MAKRTARKGQKSQMSDHGVRSSEATGIMEPISEIGSGLPELCLPYPDDLATSCRSSFHG
ncbi:hypothetical protein THOG11_140153 [Vibrio harveyi]|nr:hypothetical protein TH15OA1_480034 [Vibrio harveyi]CAH1551394.1 hypothetical protein THOD03_150143 [Vibrio harveyi]CAH1555892.1 hypothetical protein THOG11_140153 [Vibrio harveyi]